MEQLQFTLDGILIANPQTKRAMRCKWSLKPNDTLLAYCTQKNLIIRDLKNPLSSKIYNTQVLHNLTAVKYSNNGNFIAIGDEKGGIKVIGWSSAQNDFVVQY